jgi:hypothetical protein
MRCAHDFSEAIAGAAPAFAKIIMPVHRVAFITAVPLRVAREAERKCREKVQLRCDADGRCLVLQ